MVSEELADNQLVHNQSGDSLSHALKSFLFVAVPALLLAFGAKQIFSFQRQLQENNLTLQVTNRNFSLFLWQLPEYMRMNVSMKVGYLPAFQYEGKVGIEEGKAEDYVQAPSEVLFIYHTWERLVGHVLIPRVIDSDEFLQFLEYCPEWHPNQWSHSPSNYRDIIDSIRCPGVVKNLPKKVQQAFIGWKNFFLEGDLIDQTHPTYNQIEIFLEQFPQFARNYWINIIEKKRPNYLKFSSSGDDIIPESEISGFLKVAYYNFAKGSHLQVGG